MYHILRISITNTKIILGAKLLTPPWIESKESSEFFDKVPHTITDILNVSQYQPKVISIVGFLELPPGTNLH